MCQTEVVSTLSITWRQQRTHLVFGSVIDLGCQALGLGVAGEQVLSFVQTQTENLSVQVVVLVPQLVVLLKKQEETGMKLSAAVLSTPSTVQYGDASAYKNLYQHLSQPEPLYCSFRCELADTNTGPGRHPCQVILMLCSWCGSQVCWWSSAFSHPDCLRSFLLTIKQVSSLSKCNTGTLPLLLSNCLSTYNKYNLKVACRSNRVGTLIVGELVQQLECEA